MAEVTIYRDDLDGSEGAEPHEFEAFGKRYRADLTTDHQKEVAEALATVQRYLDIAVEVRVPVVTAFNQLTPEERAQCRKDLKRPTGRIQDADVEAWRTKKAEEPKRSKAAAES